MGKPPNKITAEAVRRSRPACNSPQVTVLLLRLLRSPTDLPHDYETSSNQVTPRSTLSSGCHLTYQLQEGMPIPLWSPAGGGGIDIIRLREVLRIPDMGWGTHTQDDHSCCPSLTPRQTAGLHTEFAHTHCLRRKNIEPGWRVVLHDILISQQNCMIKGVRFPFRMILKDSGDGIPLKGQKVKYQSHCCVIPGKWLLPSRVGGSDDVWVETRRRMLSPLHPSYCIHLHLHKRRK